MADTKISTETPKDDMQVEKEKLESVKRADAAVKSMHDFTSPEVLYKELISSVLKYHPSTDISMIEKAYKVASEAHEGQKRKSGEPYIIHPLCVAIILADLELDKESIIAGILHDVVEDTVLTEEELAAIFGKEVALLVDGVTKLTQIKFSNVEDRQAENLRKMLLAMSQDVRVMIIKLCDRLHNMRTGDAWPEQKRRDKALETMEVYAPIAHRLGISNIKEELEDRSLHYLDPVGYETIRDLLNKHGDEFLHTVCHTIAKHLAENGIQKATIRHRVKSIYGIYRKMYMQNKDFEEIYDIYAVRIILENVSECYNALGLIHDMYHPLPNRFKDYISTPKPNGYQSLHTTVIGPGGLMVEFQIRTEEMHHICEDGITAHWLYRDRNTSDQLQRNTMDWLNGLLEIQKQSGTSLEFMENIKVDIFPDRVYVFSPRGRIIQLPKGSTAVDFAYQIHTDLGNCTIGCEINGETAPLTRELKNGEMINIIKGDKPTPNPSWLSSVRTGKARAEIRQYMRSLSEEGKIELGSKLLERSSKSHHLPYSKVTNEDWTRVCKANGFTDKNALLDAIGSGQKDSLLLLHQLTAPYTLKGNETATTVQQSQEPVLALKGQICKLAPCCTPAMDDVIIGHYIAGTNTLHVHRKDCSHVQRGMRTDPENWRDLQWNSQYKGGYPVKLDIELTNTHATLERLTSMIAQQHSSVTGFAMSQQNGVDKVELTILVGDTKHLQKIINAIRTIDTVRLVSRHLESTPAMKPVDVEIDE